MTRAVYDGSKAAKQQQPQLHACLVQMVIQTVTFSGLHKSIEKSLSAEERIEELCKFCVQVQFCVSCDTTKPTELRMPLSKTEIRLGICPD